MVDDVEPKIIHNWPNSKAEAVKIQNTFAAQVNLLGNTQFPKMIGAVDTAYGFGGKKVYAAAVVMTFPELEEVEKASYFSDVKFPYFPGLFYFREGPAITEALKKLKKTPEVLIVHGHGVAHPKRCGLASHIGIAFDIPTIGCARKILVGSNRPVEENRGSFQPIVMGKREVGLALRSKDRVKPIYISPAHQCDIDFAREIIVKCLRGYRLPEPLRLAHSYANKYKRYVESGKKSNRPKDQGNH